MLGKHPSTELHPSPLFSSITSYQRGKNGTFLKFIGSCIIIIISWDNGNNGSCEAIKMNPREVKPSIIYLLNSIYCLRLFVSISS